jgi:hypothetical protein
MRSFTQARNNLVLDPTLIASTSFDTDQWLERFETTVGDICELLAAMTTRFEKLSEDRRSGTEVGFNNKNKNKGERSMRTAAGTIGLVHLLMMILWSLCLD